MAVMTREQKEMLDQLRILAGDPETLLEALRNVSEQGQPTELRRLVHEILRLRQEREAAGSLG